MDDVAEWRKINPQTLYTDTRAEIKEMHRAADSFGRFKLNIQQIPRDPSDDPLLNDTEWQWYSDASERPNPWSMEVEEWETHDANGRTVNKLIPYTRLDVPPNAIAHVFDEHWAWQDHLRAREDGWLLDCDAVTNEWQIKKSIHTATFDSHEQARAFVEMLVQNDNALAVKAYARIMISRLTGK